VPQTSPPSRHGVLAVVLGLADCKHTSTEANTENATVQLDVEQEVHDVAVLDDVLLAFDAHLAGALDRGF
jgi:hypothetical protein